MSMKKFFFYLAIAVVLFIGAATVPFYAYSDTYAQVCAMYGPAREALFHSNAYISGCIFTMLGLACFYTIKATECAFFGDKE